MKKLVLIFTCTLLYISGTAQYEQGDIDLSLGTGLGIYGASTNDVDEVDTNGVDAAAGLLSFRANFAVIDNLAIGVVIERNGFITPNDSSNTDSYGTSMNYRFASQFRFVNSEKNCLAVKGEVGYSSFKFGDRISNEFVKGSGLTYEFGLNWEHYFGEHVGMYMNFGYGGYKYNELVDHNGDVWRTNNDTDNVEFTIGGVNSRIGLQIKI